VVAGGLRGTAVAADSAAEGGVSAAEARDRVGSQMRTREFLSKLEHDRIVSAIREAESKTSGEIRVYVQRGKLNADPLIVAQKKFQRLGMHKTRERNAVLIFVAPRAHKFAVVGDDAIHEKCGDEFWQRIVTAMHHCFRQDKFTEGIGGAIAVIGDMLAQHFPRGSTSSNQLPDDVVQG
jgi:uncharacterized membrane protein